MHSDLEQFLATQDRLITRRQSLTFMTQAQVTARLGKFWQVVLPGVYATFTGPLAPRHKIRAALLHAGDDAMVDDLTALLLYRLHFLPSDNFFRVLVDATSQPASRDLVVIRRTRRLPAPVMVGGFPCVPLARALTAFAARHPFEREAFAVVAAAVQQRRVSLADLLVEADLGPNRGRTQLYRILDQLGEGVRSAAELDFRSLVRGSLILPEPLWNCLIRLPSGVLLSPDGLFTEARLIHEVNGRRYHAYDNGSEDQFESMQVRHDLLIDAGFIAIHNSPQRIRTRGPIVLAQVEAIYSREVGRGMPPGVEIIRRGPA